MIASFTTRARGPQRGQTRPRWRAGFCLATAVVVGATTWGAPPATAQPAPSERPGGESFLEGAGFAPWLSAPLSQSTSDASNALPTAVPPTPADAAIATTAGFVVKYAPGVVAPMSADAAVPGGDTAGVDLSPGAPAGLGWYEVDLASPVDQATAEQIAQQLMSDPAVAYAEPQIWVMPAAHSSPAAVSSPAATPVPDDPLWAQQWGFASYGDDTFQYPGDGAAPPRGLDRQTTGTNLREALAAQRGPSPTVAVIDTGVTNHPDLVGRLTSGYNFISDPTRAGNGFGRDTDYTDLGDWVTPDQAASYPFSLLGCPAPSPSSWHGTHVSGTIAALTDNALGIAGVAPAEIQTLRTMGRCGGSTGDISAAIVWAAGGSIPGIPDNDRPARVINLSLGAVGFCPQHMQDAIDFATERGAVVVAAAGNLNSDAAFFLPGNCAGVINVAATDPYGGRATFSNYGTYVDVAAPGDGIVSTLDSGLQGPQGPTYGATSGTSMAAPVVSGAVALLLAAKPYLTPQQVRDEIAASATPFKQTRGFASSGVSAENPAYDCVGDDPCGAGYLNTAALLGVPTADPPVIAPRYQARAAGGGTAVRIVFEPSPGGADDYAYRIARGQTLLAEGTTTATDVTVNISGPASAGLTVLITPRTKGRPGVAAAAMRVRSVTGAAPSAPRIESVDVLSDAARITVNNTYATPGITESIVTAEPGGLSCQLDLDPTIPNLSDGLTTCVITDLTAGTEYTFTAKSGNSVGMSPPSTPVQATPQSGAPPTRPRIDGVTLQGNTATVRWRPSVADTGRRIAGYVVVAVGSDDDQLAQCVVVGAGVPPLANFCDVPNLYADQEYQFVVTAVDDSGAVRQSLASPIVRAPSGSVPPSASEDPPWVQLGDGRATMGLNSPPLFNGGSRILGLRFVAEPGGAMCDIPWSVDVFADTCDIEGLDSSTQYTFTVSAFNAMGLGPPSDPTIALTPVAPVPMGELVVLPQPVRVLDTRNSGILRPGRPLAVDVQAPPGALAVAYNLTITGTTGSGYASLYPNGPNPPGTSVINWTAAAQTVANAHVSGLGADGKVAVAAVGTRAHAVLDVTGYYVDPFAPLPPEVEPPLLGSRLIPRPPARAYDSRLAGGPIVGGSSRTVDVSALVPHGAQAVAYTLTETGTTRSGFLSVGLPGQPPPATSVLNWSGPNQTVANTATAALDGNRRFEVFASGTGSTQIVVDVIGYFAPLTVSPDGLLFAPIRPQRAYDSRSDTPAGPLSAWNSITTNMARAGVPEAAGAVAANLTATGTVASGWLALTPGGSFTPGGISTLNWMRSNSTLANGTIIGTSSNNVTTYGGGGSAHYLLDIAGYYIRPRD